MMADKDLKAKKNIVTSGDIVEYEVVVTDKDGKVIQRIKGPSKSYLRAYTLLMLMVMKNGSQTIRDTAGNNRTCDGADHYALGTEAGAGNVDRGTRFGTGDTAVDIEDYALEAPIAHGTGDGQLSYGGCVALSPTVNATSSGFPLSRTGTNSSGGTIVVREIGVYTMARWSTTIYYFCMVRDVLSSPATIPNGATITVIYTFKCVE